MNVLSNEQSTSTEQSGWLLIFCCWILAVTATLGSLFFSEIMAVEPCVLCWYQRIFMYPLVVIFLVGLFPLDSNVARYALPIALIGWSFAIYHYLLYSGYIPEDLQPCGPGLSCTEINFELFGFLTIPILSVLSFTTIIVLLIIFRIRTNR